MIDFRTLQENMKAAGFYKIAVDGKWGGGSRSAQDAWLIAAGVKIDAWPDSRRFIALNQLVLKRNGFDPHGVDGMAGDGFKEALRAFQIANRETDPSPHEVTHQPALFPRQADVEKVFGKPGTNLVMVDLPYPFRLAWDKKQTVKRVQMNAKAADSFKRALQKALDHYGLAKIQELGLDIWGGGFNNRAMRGGTRKSMHAYGIAHDFDPERNQLRWGSDRAQMAKPEYAAFLDAFESEGWISLGRERNFDWMHVQAARL
jgi:hypothetical protein